MPTVSCPLHHNAPRRSGASSLVFQTFAALTLLASPASAETFHFGQASISFDGREVIFSNGQTGRDHPQDFNRDLTAEGITVRVVVMQEGNPAPDTFMVIPPAGYIAVPEMVTVEEGDIGLIIIAPEGLS
jgi:hypothetical protein